ncbi:MAG: DsbA family protein [Gemmatimonadales bacterium]|nr:thioredoxin domain-containing protein [Gemmatimonadota bacterium]MCC7131582.1 thioredoxin domain-containing protein [Gemmatimonadales bacterium]MDX2057067.1 DsbA family protein [Gemmatimonadales bacterium]
MRLAAALVLSLGTVLPATLAAQDVPLSARAKGSPNAPITVYEMSDFQCPFCRRHAIETFPALERDYIRTGKVRWVFVNYPLTSIHANAVAAAAFAMCAAKQNKFWPAHDLLFLHQETWGPLKNPAPFLLTLADSLKLAKPAITSCLEKEETVAQIKADAEGASKSGAQSTPTFYVDGGLIVGAQPLPLFRMVLDSIYAAKTRKP